MRAVFVNLSHPDNPHVSSVRVPSFARAMARRGHRVILLTKTLRGDASGISGEELAKALEIHDWSSPFCLPVRPRQAPVLKKLRAGGLAKPLSKALTLWYFLRYSGVHWDWSEGARELEQVLAERYRPDVVWATFLSPDALVIAQRLAERAGCPWFVDLKDGWSYRLPRGLRSLMAWRFKSASGLTANSRIHGEQGKRWFKREVITLYDGISAEFVNARDGSTEGRFRIVLVGGTYGEERLASFLRGLRNWLLTLSEMQRSSVCLTYAGSDSDIVQSICTRNEFSQSLCEIEILGYLPLIQLADLCASASVNAYLWLPSTFHHKVLELLVCGPPVLAFPGEFEEARELASRLGGELCVCENEDGLVRTLGELWMRRLHKETIGRPKAMLEAFTWDSQSAVLEEALLVPTKGSRSR